MIVSNRHGLMRMREADIDTLKDTDVIELPSPKKHEREEQPAADTPEKH